MDLKEITPTHIDGFLVISDIHAEYDRMMQAINYALSNYLHIIFLGDLVDGGDKPFETIEEVYSLLEKDRAVCVIGNHDYKWYRAIKDETPVVISDYMAKTVWDVPMGLEEAFLETYRAIYEHDRSYYHMNYEEWYFAHAAMPPEYFYSEEIKRNDRDRMMYGFTNGKRDDRGYPVRLYEWIDEIPKDHRVIVGHDRAPLGKKFDGKPEMVSGTNGGMAIFTDTGCGKRPDGTLTTVSLLFTDDGLTFERFITF